jgi:O-antigen ligase
VDLSRSPRRDPVIAASGSGFVLFLLLTAVLFIRPSDILPPLLNVPVFELLIVSTMLACFPVLLEPFSLELLWDQPGILCVYLLLPAVVLSNLSHGDLYSARVYGNTFARTLVYFVLLIAVLDRPRRLRAFLLVVAVLILVDAAIALLSYHGRIELPGLEGLTQSVGVDEETGETLAIVRLRGAGIFNDPNDIALILAVGAYVCITFFLESKGSWARRLAAVSVLAVLAYAMVLTHSRGGFLALTAGMMAFLVARVGWRRSVPLAAVLLPILLVLFGGRATNISLSDEDDTGYERIQLWAEAIVFFKRAPVFGIGQHMFAEEVGMVAHNSYAHCFAELGIVGGTLFVAAFYLPLSDMRQRLKGGPPSDPVLARWYPCVLAILVSYAVGLWSLSRSYMSTTYFVLGVAGAYCRLLARDVPAPPPLVVPLVVRVGIVSAACLFAIYLFVRAFS